ncbi:glycosyltransferase [Janthinobacterium sp. 17J80-10]|nr:glycosyltransferase [Janthinobacterium sp. 17J80-10]
MTSTSYPANRQDWRGRFIANLVTGLSRQTDIQLSLWAPPGEMPAGVQDATSNSDRAWLQGMSQRGGVAHLLRSHPIDASRSVFNLLKILRHAYRTHGHDVAHVNWLQNALPLWGTNTPALISVLGTDFGLLRLPGMTAALRSVFKQRRTILAPNSTWMASRLVRAFGDVAEVTPVPFGVDDAWFEMKRQFTNDNTHHWLAITRLTANKIGDLFAWGDGKFGGNRVLHLFGPMQEQIDIPQWVQYHGPTHPEELLNNWFPRASGLITLSRHDEGRPQVMLEAMAAGLPVIASEIAAHRDIIQHELTGWIAKSSQDFHDALVHLENQEFNQVIGNASRNWAKQHIGNWDDCASRYAALYLKLLAS